MEKLTIQRRSNDLHLGVTMLFRKDIVAKYTQPAPPYTTVASIVKNLERERICHTETCG